MPTYDYHCDKCGHEFEAFQSMTADLLAKCPECGKKALRRLIGAGAGIIFKGPGFYATDYKRGSGAKKSKASDPSDGAPSGPSDGASSGPSDGASSEASSSGGSSD